MQLLVEGGFGGLGEMDREIIVNSKCFTSMSLNLCTKSKQESTIVRNVGNGFSSICL